MRPLSDRFAAGLLAAGLLALLPSHAMAQASDLATAPLSDAVQESRPFPTWSPSLQAGYLYQFDTGIDRGGDFSINRANLRVGLSYVFDPDRSVGLSLGYGYHNYRFSPAPPSGDIGWTDIQEFRLGLPLRWRFDDSWSAFALPMVRFSGESGADPDDGLTGGFIGGFSYRFGDHLTLGPGVGLLGQIEDDPSLFPVLFIDWELLEDVTLRTGRGFGASQGPGLVLSWQCTDRLELGLGARYERLRFRLDDNQGQLGGVGEDKGIPVYLAASYAFSRVSQLSIIAGAEFGGSLAVEDANGNRRQSRSTDPAPFVGVTYRFGF